ncbi:hypothetical protein GJAV_G00173530 [Gymnothorax javanicus]|nr:hypothetical protein GJAV_G00173530 [Gymnothorax javanicus]
MSDFVILVSIVLLLLILLVTIMGFLLYSGLLSEVHIRTGSPPIKNITIAYKFRVGPYKDCGSIFSESCSIGPKLRCIGVYYSDPNTTPAEKCRYAVGSILCEGEEKPDEDLVQQYQKSGFKIITFPEVTRAVSSAFPNRTNLSFLLGIYRVYPRLSNYIKEHGLCARPCLEVYRDDVIQYICPLDHQDEFNVPGACEESDEDRQDSPEASPLLAGVDPSSESGSVSQTVTSESVKTSPAPTAASSQPEHKPDDGGSNSDRSSAKSEDSASSFEELGLELGRGQGGDTSPPASEVSSLMPNLPTNEQAEGEE